MAAVTGIGRADRLASPAEAELYERNSSRIFGYCLSRLGRREDAEDATQLTFLHAVRGLRRGVVPAAESAWLLGIARNVCLARWASAERRGRVEAACDPAELERLAHAREQARDELIGLESALESLPEQQRRAVLLRDWRGLSYEEIADRLGVSRAAVETLIFRGRAALAEQLDAAQREPRRRGRALGGLWSLLDAVKGAFGGAATGAKLAVAVAATVAVSGGGIALGTTLAREPAARPTAAKREHARPAAGRADSPARAASDRPTRRESSRVERPGASRGQAPSTHGVPTSEGAPGGAAATPGGTPAPSRAGETGAQPDAVVRAEAPLPEPLSPAVPALPPAALPSTDEVVAATEPVVAVVSETLDSAALPQLPAVEVPKVELPAATTPTPLAAPPSPTAPTVPSLP